MTDYDVLIKGGVVVDGTGAKRGPGDVAVLNGKIAAVGALNGARAQRVIDARGLIVAPGIIDTHTHYDAQINWDPYCTSSGWHGVTSAVIANCGFGYAPAKPDQRERYMLMMVNTEQVPLSAQSAGMNWDWESFPEWLDHLKRLPKGVNIAAYLPLNPLLSYVIGPDEAKRRGATPAERKRMRELLHEAMDAGAIGFSFSFLGDQGNSHVDFDQTPMPTDIMAEEEAFNLCEVLRERNEGVIQVLVEFGSSEDGSRERLFTEKLAEHSGRPVLHNATFILKDNGTPHLRVLTWLNDCAARGLNIWGQVGTNRVWFEFKVMDYNNWDMVPAFRALGVPQTKEGKLELIRSSEYRERLRREYDPEAMRRTGSVIEEFVLHNAGGVDKYVADEGRLFGEIARERQLFITDLFLDVLSDSELEAEFRVEGHFSEDTKLVAEMMRHPRTIAGLSDGGAHGRFFCAGQWATDIIRWMVRETGEMEPEELHQILSGRTCDAFGFTDRGTLEVGKAADILVYDPDEIGFEHGRYTVLHDLPGGEWRRVVPAQGVSYILVNGQVTFDHGSCTNATPGTILVNREQTPVPRERVVANA